MKKARDLLKYYCTGMVLCILLVLMSCTQNPFFDDDKINQENRWLRGDLMLDNGMPAKGAAVWFSAYDVGTYTDHRGHFEILMPSSGGNLENGLFTLYFYVNNYQLESAAVLIRDGNVVEQQGDIGINGELANVCEFQQILSAHSVAGLHVDDNGVEFLTLDIRCNIKSPPAHIWMRGNNIGAFFLDPLENGENDLLTFDHPQEIMTKLSVYNNRWTGRILINVKAENLKTGTYQFTPWIVTEQAGIPEGLKAFVGYDTQNITSAYLDFPFYRTGGVFWLGNDGLAVEVIDLDGDK